CRCWWRARRDCWTARPTSARRATWASPKARRPNRTRCAKPRRADPRSAAASAANRSDPGDAPGFEELAAPVAVELRHRHLAAGARGVHEAAFAEVDADVVDAAAAAEEH